MKFLTLLLSLFDRLWTAWNESKLRQQERAKTIKEMNDAINEANCTWRSFHQLLLILSALNGCATVSTVPANSYCVIAKPITYDVTKDTSETAREIEAHNSIFVCLCENDCPKDK
jgi:hypothetical protein